MIRVMGTTKLRESAATSAATKRAPRFPAEPPQLLLFGFESGLVLL